MKKALEWSIRIFWGFFGLASIYVAFGIAQYRLFHRPPPMDWVSGLFLLSMAFVLTAVIFTAYFAVFRFSLAVVKPSVFVVSLILWSIACSAIRVHLQPWIEGEIESTTIIIPLMGVLAFPLSIIAAMAFYRVTSAILVKVMFPELRHSAARIL